jgi:hypothetical protein
MPTLSGNTTGSIAGIPYNIPATISSFYLTNKTGGSITVTVSISISSNDTGNNVALFSQAIAANDTYKSDVPILLLAGFTILIVTSGSVDYFFSIE